MLEAVAVMASEGVARATASEITQRVNEDAGLELSPSVVGQRLRELGLTAAVAHGRSQFRLDEARLLEVLRREVEAKLTEAEQQAAASLTRHSQTVQRIATLEESLRNARSLPQREQALRRELQELEGQEQGVTQLQQRAAALRQQLAQGDKLQEEVSQLEARVNVLADLGQRKASLSAALQEHRQESQTLAQQEAALEKELAALKQQRGFIDLARWRPPSPRVGSNWIPSMSN